MLTFSCAAVSFRTLFSSLQETVLFLRMQWYAKRKSR